MGQTKDIAIVDDEKNLRETVKFALTKEGYSVTAYPDGAAAWERFQGQLPDLIILDITMPNMDGLEVCRKIRSISETVPVIFLSSRDEEFDRVIGLEIGADDYLCKPFSMRELQARIHVLFRRLRVNLPSVSPSRRIGNLELFPCRYAVEWDGSDIGLTVTEYQILEDLLTPPGQVKSREQLLNAAYPDLFVQDRSVDAHIKRIRKKFKFIDTSFQQIETVYGAGYIYRD